MALYAVALVVELMRISASTAINARFALRGLLELYVTLAYLLTKDDADLWRSYRVFGSGQAKLALLKLEEASDHPLAITIDKLREIANEDIWQEFLEIDIGHWANANLRDLSIKAGVKDEYDRFYPWTSMYAHGHWAAIRAGVFDTCGNALHRLHRIPRARARAQGDVLADAVTLADKLLGLVDHAYPSFSNRLGL